MGHIRFAAPLTIAAQHIFDGAGMRGPGSVRVSHGRIESVTFGEADVHASIHLAADALLAPGLIDIQVNGGGGVLFNDQPTVEGIAAIGAAHRKFGTTGLLPTLITDTADCMKEAIAAASAAIQARSAGVLGIHLEGPFLNPERKGIHRAAL